MNGFVDSAGVEPFAFAWCQAPSAPSTIYGLGGGGLPGQPIFRTDDLGRSWRERASITGLIPVDCAVDPSNPEVVFLLATDEFFIGALLKSIDGGHTWVDLSAGLPMLEAPVFVRASRTRPQTVYVGDQGTFEGLYVSRNGGSFARLPAAPVYPFRLVEHPTLNGLLFVVSSGDGLLYRSGDEGASFEQVGPSTAFINDVAVDPHDPTAVYIAVSPDGLYRSRDYGLTFARLPGPAADQLGQLGVFNVGIAPSQGRRAEVFVSTSRGPFRSDDGGATFASIHRDFHGTPVNDLGIDAAGRLMVGALNSVVVFRARKAGRAGDYDNFGVNLTTAPPNGDWAGAAVAPSTVDANVAVVVTFFNGVFSTTDSGATWTQATFAPFDPLFNYFARATFAPGSATRVYLVSSRRLGGLYRSDDAGHSFQRLSAERFGAIAVDPSNPDVAFFATFEGGHGIFKTVDGGLTLIFMGVTGDFSTLAVDFSVTQTVYAGNRAGGVLRSLDGGATWASASNGLPPGAVLAVSVDPRIPARAYAWVKAAGLFVTANSGGNWTAANTGEAARRTAIEFGRAALAVDPVRPGRVYLGNSGVLQIDTLEGSDDEMSGN